MADLSGDGHRLSHITQSAFSDEGGTSVEVEAQ